MGALRKTGTVIGCTFAGALALPLVMLAIMIVVYMVDKRCGGAGDSGGCEMGIFTIVAGSVPVGAAIGLVVGIVRAIRRTA